MTNTEILNKFARLVKERFISTDNYKVHSIVTNSTSQAAKSIIGMINCSDFEEQDYSSLVKDIMNECFENIVNKIEFSLQEDEIKKQVSEIIGKYPEGITTNDLPALTKHLYSNEYLNRAAKYVAREIESESDNICDISYNSKTEAFIVDFNSPADDGDFTYSYRTVPLSLSKVLFHMYTWQKSIVQGIKAELLYDLTKESNTDKYLDDSKVAFEFTGKYGEKVKITENMMQAFEFDILSCVLCEEDSAYEEIFEEKSNDGSLYDAIKGCAEDGVGISLDCGEGAYITHKVHDAICNLTEEQVEEICRAIIKNDKKIKI